MESILSADDCFIAPFFRRLEFVPQTLLILCSREKKQDGTIVKAEILEGNPGRLLVALRVRQADAEKCAQKLMLMNRRMAQTEGFISLDVIRRDGGLGTDFFVIARFDSIWTLEKWRGSPERMSVLAEIEEMAIIDVSRQYVAGANIWFEPIVSLPSPPKPPLLWKRWITSMIAVYPPLIILVPLLKPVTAPLPEVLGLLVVGTILTGLTTAFISPFLTRRLGPWLTRA
ncbi:hypothetical protein [Oricola indica]|uniref:hypothetical protein n=1 Tax=Oricola indica TaxID=2872591 RepID=UPI003CCBCB92